MFCDRIEEDTPMIPTYRHYFIQRERESKRGSNCFITIPVLVILCLADNNRNVEMVQGISIKGSTN